MVESFSLTGERDMVWIGTIAMWIMWWTGEKSYERCWKNCCIVSEKGTLNCSRNDLLSIKDVVDDDYLIYFYFWWVGGSKGEWAAAAMFNQNNILFGLCMPFLMLLVIFACVAGWDCLPWIWSCTSAHAYQGGWGPSFWYSGDRVGCCWIAFPIHGKLVLP